LPSLAHVGDGAKRTRLVLKGIQPARRVERLRRELGDVFG
jgi:hypothetical protein